MSNDKAKMNIYELAEITGFSVSTVSKALNNTGRISQKTREIILAKASELNYVASYHAKALSSKKSWLIGIIYADNLNIGLSHPHFSVILENFKQEVEKNGYEVTFINRKMGNTEMSYLEFCKYRNVEGVFVVNYYSLSRQIPELIESGIPMVSADLGNDRITTIASDDLKGGRLAAEYLVDLGHTKIGHIAGPQYTVSAQKRLQGFLEVMNERGIQSHYVYHSHNYGFDDGYMGAKRIVEEGLQPTAVFAASDWMALGAMKAFAEHDVKIPQDLSIIGYDNLEFLKYCTPALTTVSQKNEMIGITAAKFLMEKIAGKEIESTILDVEVVEGTTCIEGK